MPAIIHIALGSNRWHGRHGAPAGTIRAAIAALVENGLTVVATSRIRSTRPLGPSNRAFANAVVAVATDLPLVELLDRLQSIERGFGRRPGRRWGARVLDLDVVAAAAGVVRIPRLTVPHPGIPGRRFVLDPLAEIAPGWRHPLLHLTTRQLRARERRPRPHGTGSP